MNDAEFAAELPARVTLRVGGSRLSLQVLAERRAQEKPPIGEPDHEVGPGPGEDDEDDDDEDDEDDEDAVESASPLSSNRALPKKHAPVKEPPQPKEPPIEEPDKSEHPPDGDPKIDDPDEPA